MKGTQPLKNVKTVPMIHDRIRRENKIRRGQNMPENGFGYRRGEVVSANVSEVKVSDLNPVSRSQSPSCKSTRHLLGLWKERR